MSASDTSTVFGLHFENLDRFTSVRIAHTNAGTFWHAVALGGDLFNLIRINVKSGHDNHVLFTVDNVLQKCNILAIDLYQTARKTPSFSRACAQGGDELRERRSLSIVSVWRLLLFNGLPDR